MFASSRGMGYNLLIPMLPKEISQELNQKYCNVLPVPVVAIARDLGLEIYETDDFDDSQSGSIVKDDGKYVVYINSRQPLTRKRFSIAHEIGHFLKHKPQLDKKIEMVDSIFQPVANGVNVALHRREGVELTAEEKILEQEANGFAAELLMPEKVFKETFEKANTIEEVAKVFDVSASAATIRAKNLFGVFMS